MAKMATANPTRKVVSSTLAAALSVLLIWLIEISTGLNIPEAVEAAILTILVFATGYLTPPSHIDQLKDPS